MDSFWKWLMRANARAVCGAAIIGLVLTGIWWTWKEFAPVRPQRRIETGGHSEAKSEDLGLLSMLDATNVNSTTLNPFFTPSERKVEPSKPAPAPVPVPVPVIKQTPVAARPPHTTPPPPPISLTYRGMFRRPDGKHVALIEDSQSKASHFYAVGQTVFGLQIGELSGEGAAVVLADGSTLTLTMGEAAKIQEGRHVD